MALPEAERTAWIHGAAAVLLHSYSHAGSSQTECLKAYFFDTGEGLKTIKVFMSEKPDAPATSSVMATAYTACPTN
jgi:hypothetical protein